MNKKWSYIENRRNYQITKLMKNNMDYQTINATVNSLSDFPVEEPFIAKIEQADPTKMYHTYT